MKIRNLKETDYSAIYNLNIQLGYAYSKEKTRKNIEKILLINRDVIFVAENDNSEVIAYIHLSPYELIYHDNLINILGIVVDEKYRRLGVGKLLLEKAEKYATDNGYSGIRLNSGCDRTGAHKFYEKCGFVHRKNQKNYIRILD